MSCDGSPLRFTGTKETRHAWGAGLGYDIHGSAKMTVGPSSTVVKINVSGLDPSNVYGSHLHDGTCASGGEMHYKDTAGGDSAPLNERWLTNSGTSLRSVVVHDKDGARIACADLGRRRAQSDIR